MARFKERWNASGDDVARTARENAATDSDVEKIDSTMRTVAKGAMETRSYRVRRK